MRRAGASGSSVARLPVSDGRGVSVKRTSFQPDLAPASGSRGATPSSGCRGMKAACALSRARKLWSWVPGRDSLRRVVKGAIALVRVFRGGMAPEWCREAKPPSWVAGSAKAPRTGAWGVKPLLWRDATGGRSATLAKPAPLGAGTDGQSVHGLHSLLNHNLG